MYAQQLGLGSSWKMLTRDKGWIKPMLILTLVGWIPILGQIVLLGYALEWARLTAWGVDAAPKQRGINYGKLFSTGGIAFLVTLTMGLVLGIIEAIFIGDWVLFSFLPMGLGLASGSWDVLVGEGVVRALVVLVVNLLAGTFMTAAALRATVYDSFTAGWRLDRLFQMIGRDPKGFFTVYGITLVCGFINWLYATAITVIGGVLAALGVGAIGIGMGLGHMHQFGGFDIALSITPGLLLLIVVLVVAAIFAGALIGTVTQLLSVNAMGQWFCRFEVGRWGVSSAELPADVPASYAASHRAGRSDGGMPVPPQSAAAGQVANAAGEDVAAANSATAAAVPVSSAPAAPVPAEPAAATGPVEVAASAAPAVPGEPAKTATEAPSAEVAPAPSAATSTSADEVQTTVLPAATDEGEGNTQA